MNLRPKKAKTTAGWKCRNFPHPKLDCNSWYERRFSTIFHQFQWHKNSWITKYVISPMEEFDPPGYVGDGIFRCREFVVRIAG